MANSEPRPKPASGLIGLYEAALIQAVVSVQGYEYIVDFGPDLRSMNHKVGKERRCSCPLGSSCPAVQAVATYLKNGGARAPDPPRGFWAAPPAQCPICGASTTRDKRWSSFRRGTGWQCTQGGIRHYLDVQVKFLKQKLSENPWVYPPVVLRNGSQIQAYDGLKEGDRVLYPGLKREDLV